MRRLAVVAAVLLLAGCGAPTPPPPSGAPQQTPGAQPTLVGPVQPVGDASILATDLTTPWSLVRLDSGSTLISERDLARVIELTESGDIVTVGTLDGVDPFGEGGLLGLAVNPDDPGWLYAYYTGTTDNRIVRLPLVGDVGAYSLGEQEVVLEGIPKSRNHNGGRIAFGPDGMLYATAGDAGDKNRAQDGTSLGGKILRLTPDGAVPDDNPFPGSYVYSLGHRNPQGIAWDDAGQLYAAEFGQDTWDEFNRIEAGANYGWPVVEGKGEIKGYVDPLAQWATSEASPSGLAFIDGTFFLAALRGERVWAIYVDGDAANTVSWFEGDHGRIRNVAAGPNDTLWLLTSNTDGNGDHRDGADKLLVYELSELVEG